jgi:hypothetical protein
VHQPVVDTSCLVVPLNVFGANHFAPEMVVLQCRWRRALGR